MSANDNYQQMKRILYLLLPFILAAGLTACSESTEENTEFANWQERNETFMRDTLAHANRAVAAAKAQWGDAWEEHCDWRVYPSFKNTEGGVTTWQDSIAVRVVEHGTGSGFPLATDSVRVSYAGRLIPSDSYPTGYIFDHTGIGTKIEDIMDSRYEVTAMMHAGSVIEGWTTALLRMRIGDYWRVFIPANMAYGSTATTSGIPASSTLIFDIRLKAFYRVGSIPSPWK